MLENPTIELLDASSSSVAAGGSANATGVDQSSVSGIVMPEYTEKKAVTNTQAAGGTNP